MMGRIVVSLVISYCVIYRLTMSHFIPNRRIMHCMQCVTMIIGCDLIPNECSGSLGRGDVRWSFDNSSVGVSCP